jgi:hypothetical protein
LIAPGEILQTAAGVAAESLRGGVTGTGAAGVYLLNKPALSTLWRPVSAASKAKLTNALRQVLPMQWSMC